MKDTRDINDLEQVFYRLDSMVAELVTLREFVQSKLPEKNTGEPKHSSMIDPRTGKIFRGPAPDRRLGSAKF